MSRHPEGRSEAEDRPHGRPVDGVGIRIMVPAGARPPALTQYGLSVLRL